MNCRRHFPSKKRVKMIDNVSNAVFRSLKGKSIYPWKMKVTLVSVKIIPWERMIIHYTFKTAEYEFDFGNFPKRTFFVAGASFKYCLGEKFRQFKICWTLQFISQCMIYIVIRHFVHFPKHNIWSTKILLLHVFYICKIQMWTKKMERGV
jgi:hypothetical protein